MTRPDWSSGDVEEEAGADLRPEDGPPRRVLTYRGLIAMQRRLTGNRSLLSIRSSNRRTNSLRPALAGLFGALWVFAMGTHGIGWTVMMVAATSNLVLSLLIGLRVVAVGEWILRVGAGGLDYRTSLGGKDELVRHCQALESLRDRSVRVLKRRLVERMTARLEERNTELRETIDRLGTAQDRIVAQEKAAELGELTSGAAHEIRNPLNFVKNFSESACELIAEMAEHIQRQAHAIAAKRMRTLLAVRSEIDSSAAAIGLS